jgi:hypothetical protein
MPWIDAPTPSLLGRSLRSLAVQVILLVVFGCFAAFLGAKLGRAPLQTDLAELRATHSETAKLQALAAARTLQAAQQHGDTLTHALAQRQTQIDQLTTKKHHALARLATGRACLSGAAVRVLNSATEAALAGLEPVPAPPGGAADAGGAFATDADVGQWAVDARARFDTCRARLDALIDWHTTAPQPEPAP